MFFLCSIGNINLSTEIRWPGTIVAHGFDGASTAPFADCVFGPTLFATTETIRRAYQVTARGITLAQSTNIVNLRL